MKYFSKSGTKTNQRTAGLAWLVALLRNSSLKDDPKTPIQSKIYEIANECESANNFIDSVRPHLQEAHGDEMLGKWATYMTSYLKGWNAATFQPISENLGWELGCSKDILEEIANEADYKMPTESIIGIPMSARSKTTTAAAAAEPKPKTVADNGPNPMKPYKNKIEILIAKAKHARNMSTINYLYPKASAPTKVCRKLLPRRR